MVLKEYNQKKTPKENSIIILIYYIICLCMGIVISVGGVYGFIQVLKLVF